MKKILTYISFLILSNTLSGQMEIKENLSDIEIKAIMSEYESIKPIGYTLSERNKNIDKIIISEFLRSEFDKELAFLAKYEDVNEVIKFTSKVIENLEDNQNLFFIPENNVFLNLYKKVSNKDEQKALTELLINYLSKCQDIYYINWLYGINLLSKYENKTNIKRLLKSKFHKIEHDQLFEVIYFLIPFSDEKQIDKWVTKIDNNIKNPSHKISLIYQLVKNCELSISQKENILFLIDNINPSEIYFDSKMAIETIKKDINLEYEISKEFFYSFSNKAIIRFLTTELNKSIPNYVEHLIDIKFVGNYFRRNEAILSWILKYSNTASSYYSHPEYIELVNNKFYNEVFQFAFLDLSTSEYSYLINDSNKNKVRIKTLLSRTLYSKMLDFDSELSIGNQIENYINEIFIEEKSDLVLKRVNFEYPMFIVETTENHQKLQKKFKLKE